MSCSSQSGLSCPRDVNWLRSIAMDAGLRW
jgi:hypothetical protein